MNPPSSLHFPSDGGGFLLCPLFFPRQDRRLSGGELHLEVAFRQGTHAMDNGENGDLALEFQNRVGDAFFRGTVQEGGDFVQPTLGLNQTSPACSASILLVSKSRLRTH